MTTQPHYLQFHAAVNNNLVREINRQAAPNAYAEDLIPHVSYFHLQMSCKTIFEFSQSQNRLAPLHGNPAVRPILKSVNHYQIE